MSQFITGEVELVALGVNDDIHPPGDAFGLGLGGKAFRAADTEEFHRPRQFPALRQGNRLANAHIGPWAETNDQAFDLGAVKLRLMECLLHQAQRVRCTPTGLDGLAQSKLPGVRPTMHHGHAQLR